MPIEACTIWENEWITAPSEIDERVSALAQLAHLARSSDEAAELHFRRGEALRVALRAADAVGAFAESARVAPDPVSALQALVATAEEAGQAQVALAARRDLAELAARRGEAGAGEESGDWRGSAVLSAAH